MNMARKILVGVDGSDTALRAAHRAAEIAEATGAELHVVSAVNEVEAAASMPSDLAGDVPRLTPGERAERIAQQVADVLTVTTVIHAGPAVGKPADALVQVAKEIDADLIVVGNRRVQGIGRVLGSVAGGVAQQAPCDVYIVKTH